MRNVPLKLVGCLLVFVGGSGIAAADQKNYPGAACLASDNDIIDISRQTITGRAFNTAVTPKIFVCPGVKEAGTTLRGYAYVVDQHPAAGPIGRLTCFLRSGRPLSLVVNSSTDVTPPLWASAIPARLDFSAIGIVPAGFHWMSCTVPGGYQGQRSGVVTYNLNET